MPLTREQFDAFRKSGLPIEALSSTPWTDLDALLRERDEAERVLARLLLLPCAKLQLMYLDKGIGTATEDAVWLDVRKIVERK